VGEPRVEREAKAARDAGFGVEVVCLRGPGEPRREIIDGVAVRRLPLAHKRGASVVQTLLEYVGFTLMALALLTFRRCPSVVHVHNPPDFLVAAAIPLKLRGATLLFDVHDLTPHMYDVRSAGRRGAKPVVAALRLVQRAACAVSDQVITVHEPYRRELVADGADAAKVTVVMNSADERLVARVIAEQQETASTEQPFTIAYHGTITGWYGVDLLVEALAQLRNGSSSARAVILGAGDALDEARTRAAELGVSERVEFSGCYLPIEQALAKVAGADCGVIPNRPSTLNRFALSSKLFEYVALGIPVVVARLETLAAHFGPDHVTFFEPGDSESLAAALDWVARHPDEASAKAHRAKQHATRYSWTANRERYVALLDREGA
jgi:glycosyltransferase involved in cell wall biosynthesis